MSNESDVSQLHELTVNVVKFVLNNSIDKRPIKRADIAKHALGDNAKILKRVIGLAQDNLREYYGLDLVDVDNAKTKQYICVSVTPAVSSLEYTKKQQSELTLLFLILSVMFMRGPMNEEAITHYLARYKIDIREPHPYFGNNLYKLITETFVKQLYLTKEKEQVDAITQPTFIYSWGFRSEIEFPKGNVLEAVSDLLQKPPSSFVAQYREVCNNVVSDDEDMNED